MPKPLQREPYLQPLSHQHHEGLFFCLHLRKGLQKEVSPDRMGQYCQWFWEIHLVPHFEMEEEFVFPILGNDHPLVSRAVGEHRQLKQLFQSQNWDEKQISTIAQALNDHIRFEERVLFEEIQKEASEQDRNIIAAHHRKEKVQNSWRDRFWDGKVPL